MRPTPPRLSPLRLSGLKASTALTLIQLGIHDVVQSKRSILRSYPVIGHLRYFFEQLGEYFRQYFFAGDRDEMPFNRSTRGWVYRLAKNEGGTVGFGSTYDLHLPGALVFFLRIDRPALCFVEARLPDRQHLARKTQRYPCERMVAVQHSLVPGEVCDHIHAGLVLLVERVLDLHPDLEAVAIARTGFHPHQLRVVVAKRLVGLELDVHGIACPFALKRALQGLEHSPISAMQVGHGRFRGMDEFALRIVEGEIQGDDGILRNSIQAYFLMA